MNNIFDKLKAYSDSDYYAFHMPGHKRNLDLMDGTSTGSILQRLMALMICIMQREF